MCDTVAREWWLEGCIQAVGFRPFVYRLANQYQLQGEVRNHGGSLQIIGQGEKAQLDQFEQALIDQAPRHSTPKILKCSEIKRQTWSGFKIAISSNHNPNQPHLALDYPVCEECLDEMYQPKSRRYLYPFISCTQCGPRFTVMRQVPYDRDNTSFAKFPPCPVCNEEYSNPDNRRFHAQNISCASCGPQLSLSIAGKVYSDTRKILKLLQRALLAGKVIASKGQGGYHLMCDATQSRAVEKIRQIKQRPGKPLAVMFPLENNLQVLREHIYLNKQEQDFLSSEQRAILLLEKRAISSISRHVNPSLKHIGCMLPSTPFQHMLLNKYRQPLVATSANRHGEPITTTQEEIEEKFSGEIEVFVHNNLEIQHGIDDSLYHIQNEQLQPLRLGRGITPLELTLPKQLVAPLLALGGQLKNNIALAWQNRVVISPHMGNLDNPKILDSMLKQAQQLQQLYGVTTEKTLCDKHPGYSNHQWAKQQPLNDHTILHHHAHASALAGEYPEVDSWLCFTWDGLGYGEDGALWGGETFLGSPGTWQRVASFRPFRLPGGNSVHSFPWKTAAALCWEASCAWPSCPEDQQLLKAAWHKQLNTHTTSSIGRLFDGMASLLDLKHQTSYEGEAAMILESVSLIEGAAHPLPLRKNSDGLLISDWRPLIPHMLNRETAMAQRAANFHATLAQAILKQAMSISEQTEIEHIGLCGGVFQNRLLSRMSRELLEKNGFQVHQSKHLPCNDASLAYGQIIEQLFTSNDGHQQ